MNVAVIPARAGSKRIPHKNIRLFHGRPMIAWSIRAALESQLFDRVIVSTDCDQIAAIAEDAGATVPFRRPAALADDFAPTIPVIRHAIDALTSLGERPATVCCLYATAPFVVTGDLIAAHEKLQADPSLDFVFPATTFPFPIQRALRVSGHQIAMMWPEHANTRSQDLEEAWHDAGQFYVGRREAWLNCEHFFTARAAIIQVPRYRVQDVDTLEDWTRAERMFQALAVAPASP